ncbi:MAG: OsmC family protein [Acidobacteria bacterium]|nr:OsmC family protein [Acidobacteriota bacterium]
MVKIKRIPQQGLRISAKMETPHRVAITAGDKSLKLDMPQLLGGTHQGIMPLEALLAAYAGSLNVVGNFVAKTMDFHLEGLEFTIWSEFDPSGIWGIAKVKKAILVLHVEARVTTFESERRLAELRNKLAERDPVHNLFKSAGVRFQEKWQRISPGVPATSSRKS